MSWLNPEPGGWWDNFTTWVSSPFTNETAITEGTAPPSSGAATSPYSGIRIGSTSHSRCRWFIPNYHAECAGWAEGQGVANAVGYPINVTVPRIGVVGAETRHVSPYGFGAGWSSDTTTTGREGEVTRPTPPGEKPPWVLIGLGIGGAVAVGAGALYFLGKKRSRSRRRR